MYSDIQQKAFKVIKITLAKSTFPSFSAACSTTIDLLNAIVHWKTMNQCSWK